MKNIVLLFLLFILSSCKENLHFESNKIFTLTNEEINKLKISESYFDDYFYYVESAKNRIPQKSTYNQNIYKPYKPEKEITVITNDGHVKRINKSDFKTIAEQKKIDASIRALVKSSNSAESKEKIIKEKDKYRKIFHEQKKKGLLSEIKLKNNLGQNLETGIITTVITFKYPNRQFYYFHSVPFLDNKSLWKNKDVKLIQISNVFDYAYDYKRYKEILQMHSPKNINIEYFISISNSVGYSNYQKTSNLYEYIENPLRGYAINFGAFRDKNFSENDILNFGVKVHDEDINKALNFE